MGNLVVKSNALIEASYSLNLIVQRMILLAILQARRLGIEIGSSTKIKIYASTYSETYGVSISKSYQALVESVSELYNAEFTYDELDAKGIVKHNKARFVDYIGYARGEGAIELVFGSQIIPHITELKKLFTSYEIEQTRQLNKYGLRLYELLMRWYDKRKLEISLEELRSRLGLLPDEYKAMSNFKIRVLDSAVKEINEFTDIEVKYKQKKQGRTIIGFDFTFKVKPTAKKAPQKPLERDPNTADMFTKLTDKQLARLVHSKKFISDYGHLVSPGNPANQSSSAWVAHMVEWLKKDPTNFTKRPMQEYLDDQQSPRF